MADIAAPRPAATVILVRQRAEMEVLMVVRSKDAHFGSAMVFAGGLLDREDSAALWSDFAHGGEGLAPQERALRVCAFRELYEETGVLLGDRAEAAAPASAGNAFADALAAHGALLDLNAMHPFARWITPDYAPKRFDTHFYICGLETEVTPFEDGHETVSVEWLTPARAVELGATGQRRLMFPTRLNLQLLAESQTVDAAIAAARARRPVTVQPWLIEKDGRRYATLPSEAGYGEVCEPAGAEHGLS